APRVSLRGWASRASRSDRTTPSWYRWAAPAKRPRSYSSAPSEDFARLGEYVKPEAICFIEGRVDRRGREPNVVVNNLISIDEASRKFTDQVAIKFQRGLHGEGEIDRVGEILHRHPGRCGVAIVIESFDDDNPSIKLRYLLAPASTTRVAADGGLAAELEQVLGAGNVRFLSNQKAKGGVNGNGHKNGTGRRAASLS
ncbi:MAG: hypothetical protein ACM3U2_04740, partial [Deltaproteobacteria bacterium]